MPKDEWSPGEGTSGNSHEDSEARLFRVCPVGQPADYGVEKDDKDRSQSRQEKYGSLILWMAAGHHFTHVSNEVEKGQGAKADGSVRPMRCGEVLHGFDEDAVGLVPVGDIGDSQDRGLLGRRDCEGG